MRAAALKQSKPTFEFTPTGRQIGKKDAEILGKRFLQLEGKGQVTPEQVVEDARNPRSPLYRFFDRRGLWDDAVAAEVARLEHARWLIRSVSITWTYENGARERVRAFQSIETKDGRGYRSTPEVFAKDDLSRQVLASALAELEGWQRRYARYLFLQDAQATVSAAIGWLRTKLTRLRKAP